MLVKIFLPLLPSGCLINQVKVGYCQLFSLFQLLHDEHLFLVSGRVPLDRAIGFTGVIYSVDDWKHTHQSVVSRLNFCSTLFHWITKF